MKLLLNYRKLSVVFGLPPVGDELQDEEREEEDDAEKEAQIYT